MKRESILRSTREEEKSLSPEFLGSTGQQLQGSGREVGESKDSGHQSNNVQQLTSPNAVKGTVITCRPSEATLEEFRLNPKHENLAGPDFGKVLVGEDDDSDSR